MKKRIAYIGLSYPLLYDYHNCATKCKNDMSSSPNPIIDSPLGLMILYDELWFLCKSLCPNNMRSLPYVKFVDEIFPDISFNNFDDFKNTVTLDNKYSTISGYSDMCHKMNIDYRGVDGHTHGLKICDITTSANGGFDNYIFDLYVLTILQNIAENEVEMISNSKYKIKSNEMDNTQSELTETIIIKNIPNYLSVHGPYHECIEELRENKYLQDFRKWIITNHSNIQKNEIKDVCCYVEHNIQETKNSVFKKYLESNDNFSCFISTGKTLISTIGGLFIPAISFGDAFYGIKTNVKKSLEVNAKRWQGFVINAQEIVNSNNLGK